MNEENLLPNQAPATTPAEATDRLLRILRLLRRLCPWDKKQTFDSLRYLSIEELYELSDAILDKNYEDIRKELGDVLLHIFFYAELGREEGRFDYTDVVNGLCEKLIRRHPHIFADTEAQTDEDVKKNWEAIKLKEGKKHSVLSGVPHSLPALVKAYRIQEKARGVGFDWENARQVWEKVEEERGELQTEIQAQSTPERITEEFGDLLFSLGNYARFIGVNPEDALELANRKFIRRFQYMEERTIMQDKPLSGMSLEEMNRYWDEAKAAEKAES